MKKTDKNISQFSCSQLPSIIFKITSKFLKPGIFNIPNLIADSRNKMLIMRNYNNTTTIIIKRNN